MNVTDQTKECWLRTCERRDFKWGLVEGRGAKVQETPKCLVEIVAAREVFGNDSRAINRHSVRQYVTEMGLVVQLDRTLDADPKFFTATFCPIYFVGFTPKLTLGDQEYWGDNWSWKKAERALSQALGAQIMTLEEMRQNWHFPDNDWNTVEQRYIGCAA